MSTELDTGAMQGALQQLEKSARGVDEILDKSQATSSGESARDVEGLRQRLRILLRAVDALTAVLKTTVSDPGRHPSQHGLAAERHSSQPLAEYVASAEVAQFVRRGMNAHEEIAAERAEGLEFLTRLKSAMSSDEVSLHELRVQSADRFTQMLSVLASQARDSHRSERPIAEGSTWSTDVQYEIVSQFPVRPDETELFLHTLLSDVVAAASESRNLGGDWGEVGFGDGGKLVMRLNPAWRAAIPGDNRRGTRVVDVP